MSAVKGSKFYMGGTDGSGEYIVVATGNKGKVGYRDLGGERYRVRLEPSASMFYDGIGKILGGQWNTPSSSQNRFSVQITGTASLKMALSHALSAFGTAEEANPEAPVWALDLIKNPVDWSAGVVNSNKHEDEDEPEDEPEDEDEDSSDDDDEEEAPVEMSKKDLESMITAAETLADSLRLFRQ